MNDIMSIITMADIKKDFTITVGKKGIRGAIQNLFYPEKKVIHALGGISLSIGKKEILGLLGPNGAGKSTTVKILTGILTPTSGHAEVAGITPYLKPRLNAMNIGVVFGQRSRLWWNLPVFDSFEYTRALYSIPNELYKQNVDYFCENFGISEILKKPVRTLSLGQKMRAEIAMAMLHSPSILYLDEPTIGLDVVGKNELHTLIRKINVEKNVTVLLVTHDVMDIERLCSRVIIIDKGILVWQGNIEELKRAKGTEKHFNVVFEQPRPAIETPFLKLEQCVDGVHHTYCCEDENIEIDEVVGLFFSAGKVVDLTIADAQLDVVMRRIYSE